MFCISISVGASSWRLVYKEEEKAKQAFDSLATHGAIEIRCEDDFGQKFFGIASNINGLLFEDMGQSKIAAVEMMLQQALIQSEATKRAQNDARFRSGIVNAGVPVMSPMNGGFRA